MRTTLLTMILAGIAAGCQAQNGEWTETSMCLDVPDETTECPPAAEVDPDALVSFGWCDADVREITGEGSISSDPFLPDTGDTNVFCCYPAEARDAEPGCVIGRPFLVEGEVATAPLRPGTGWTAEVDGEPGEVDWEAMARMEHASVAAFARLTLDLMALGAPARLLAAVQLAAADEVEHARLCFGMLAKTGRRVQPGPLPVGDSTGPVTAASVAFATVREGCLGETLGAFLAARAAERCADPGTRAVLDRIAEDENRHAALSWEIVAWLLSLDERGVREAVVAAFAEPFPVVPPAGLLTPEELATWLDEARTDVLAPARQALLAA